MYALVGWRPADEVEETREELAEKDTETLYLLSGPTQRGTRVVIVKRRKLDSCVK